jgi:alpha-ketoglutarate-dependent taurine dioxygenase
MNLPERDFKTEPGAWVGPEIQAAESWIYHFSVADIAEIDAALERVKREGNEIPFGAVQFPLPNLSVVLDQQLEKIENGLGMALLRGLPRERYSDDECQKIYWGIGSHLGNPVSQNSRGHRLGHVRDEGKSYDDPTARGYQTNQKMDFHTDLMPVDVLGLFCLRTSKSGGESALVSALTVLSELQKERPDLLKELQGNFNLDWRGEEPVGEKPYFTIPMVSEAKGRTSSRIVSRQYFESTARFGAELAWTEAQQEALNAIQEIANRPELRLSMMFQEGDMQFVNNHTTFHSRTAFEDREAPELKRHLLRMWIAVDDDRRRPLSDALSGRYDWVKQGGFPEKKEHAEDQTA